MFVIGKEYNRKIDIHAKYKGQEQGGISTPAESPYIFLFSTDGGKSNGYRNEYRSDGLYSYTGGGQTGDMKMSGLNKEILVHNLNGKTIYLFESTRSAHARFIGTAEYIDHHEERRPDRNGDDRLAIIFHLDVNSINGEQQTINKPEEIKALRSMNLQKLREAALNKADNSLPPRVKQQIAYYRSEALKRYVVARSGGVCEGCLSDAPFRTKTGPYLECHHIHRRSDGGPDHPINVIALCPNCHRRAHFSEDGKTYNDKLKRVAQRQEKSLTQK